MTDTNNIKDYYSQITSVDIGAIARELIPDRITEDNQNSGILYCNCPNHESQSKRSLHIDIKKQLWICRACGIGGDVLQFVEFVNSKIVSATTNGKCSDTHRAARDYLAKRASLPALAAYGLSPDQIAKTEREHAERELVFEILTAAADFQHGRLTSNTEAVAELQSAHGIKLETARDLRIGYADGNLYTYLHKTKKYDEGDIAKTGLFNFDNQDNPHPVFVKRFMFPYMRQGRAVYTIGRRTRWTPDNQYEKAKYKKLPTKTDTRKYVSPHIKNDYFYGEDSVLSHPAEVVITEGVTDCISLLERGLKSISPVTTTFRDEDHPKLIKLCKPVKRVYICQDNEISGAGWRGTMRTAAALESERISVFAVVLPLDESHRAARARLDALGDTAPADIKDSLTAAAKQDVNSYFAAHSVGEFRELLTDALPPLVHAIRTLPKDLTNGDRSAALDPIFRQIAKLDPMEQVTPINEIHFHFSPKIPKGTIKESIKRAGGGKGCPSLRDQAEEFITICGPFLQARNYWFKYESGVWIDIEADEVVQTADVWLDENLTKGNATKRRRVELCDKVAIHPTVLERTENLNPNPLLLNMQNGMYDIDTGELIAHDKVYRSTVQLPYNYDPNAKCPRWEQFIKEVFPDDRQLQNILQEWFGYCLLPDTSQEKAMFLVGSGCNGKSKTLEVLEQLIGTKNCSHVALDKLEDRFYVILTRNKLINICGETRGNEISNSETFKKMAVGDPVSGAHKFEKTIEFRPFARLCFASNWLPRFADVSEGLYRRFLILPFQVSFMGREDKQLIDKLLAELPGIFLWSLEGYKRLRDQGGFSVSASVEMEIEVVRKSANSAMAFINDCCVESDQDDSFTSRPSLYRAYTKYCGEYGYKAFGRMNFLDMVRKELPACRETTQRTDDGSSIRGFKKLELKEADVEFDGDGVAGDGSGGAAENKDFDFDGCVDGDKLDGE